MRTCTHTQSPASRQTPASQTRPPPRPDAQVRLRHHRRCSKASSHGMSKANRRSPHPPPQPQAGRPSEPPRGDAIVVRIQRGAGVNGLPYSRSATARAPKHYSPAAACTSEHLGGTRDRQEPHPLIPPVPLRLPPLRCRLALLDIVGRCALRQAKTVPNRSRLFLKSTL